MGEEGDDGGFLGWCGAALNCTHGIWHESGFISCGLPKAVSPEGFPSPIQGMVDKCSNVQMFALVVRSESDINHMASNLGILLSPNSPLRHASSHPSATAPARSKRSSCPGETSTTSSAPRHPPHPPSSHIGGEGGRPISLRSPSPLVRNGGSGGSSGLLPLSETGPSPRHRRSAAGNAALSPRQAVQAAAAATVAGGAVGIIRAMRTSQSGMRMSMPGNGASLGMRTSMSGNGGGSGPRTSMSGNGGGPGPRASMPGNGGPGSGGGGSGGSGPVSYVQVWT